MPGLHEARRPCFRLHRLKMTRQARAIVASSFRFAAPLAVVINLSLPFMRHEQKVDRTYVRKVGVTLRGAFACLSEILFGSVLE